MEQAQINSGAVLFHYQQFPSCSRDCAIAAAIDFSPITGIAVSLQRDQCASLHRVLPRVQHVPDVLVQAWIPTQPSCYFFLRR